MLAAAVCLGAYEGPRDPRPSQDPTQPNPASQAATDQADSSRIAIVAVDGADWRVVDDQIAAGHLPAFARLKKAGTQGILKADPPRLSSITWTTVVTGRPPEEHGVLDSMVVGGDGTLVPVHGGMRRVKAAWEIWSEASRSVLVLGWPVSWPADRVRGMLASDRLPAGVSAGSSAPGLVYPPEALGKVSRQVVAPSSLDTDALSAFGDVASAGHVWASRLQSGLAAAKSWRAVAAAALEAGQPDLVAVCFELVDTVSHLAVRDRSRGERAIAAAYQEVDAALADLAARLHPATLVVVLSTHGFYPADAGIREDPLATTVDAAAAWHRPYGVFAAAEAATIAGTGQAGAPAMIGIVSPLDVLPTLLARAGLPVSADMPGKVLPALAPAGPRSRVPTHGPRPEPEPPRPDQAGDKPEAARQAGVVEAALAAGMTPLARLHLAEILYRKGDFRSATRELEAAGRVDRLDGRVSLWLARCHAALGHDDEALRAYDALLGSKRAGSDAQATALLEATTLALGAGRVPAALERVDRAPPLDREPAALVARGDAAEAEGRRQTAERSYQAALNVAPSDVTAANRLVDLLITDGRADTARVLAARLAQAYPSSPRHLALAGRAALAVKSYAEAARWFELALVLAPDDAELLALLDTARKR